MTYTPASSHFNGGTITNPVLIDTPTIGAGDGNVFEAIGQHSDFAVDGDGGVTFTGSDAAIVNIVGATGNNPAQLTLTDGTTHLVDFWNTAQPGGGITVNANAILNLGGSGMLGQIAADGTLQTAAHSAPTVGAGQLAIWFDQTNGVGNTKLMLIGKSADGTQKTASIVLA